MSDLIDRQAALELAKDICVRVEYGVYYRHRCIDPDELRELPSAQPDSKELSFTHKSLDTVSRQETIEVIDAVFPVDPMKSEYAQGIACGAALAKTYVEQLPSAQPERKKGKWIHGKELSRLYVGDACVAINYEDFRCSSCNVVVEEPCKPTWNYCPNCGAEMSE